jgi:hypothetical protein
VEVPRRAEVERFRVAGLRALVPVLALRVPVERVPVERVAALPVDLARLAAGFFAAVERFAVERVEVDFFARDPVERLVELVARAAPPSLDPPSSVHLPDSTR